MIGINMEDRRVSVDIEPQTAYIYESLTEMAQGALRGEGKGLRKHTVYVFKDLPPYYVFAKGPKTARAAIVRYVARNVSVEATDDRELFQAIADLAKEDTNR